eukprot:1611069-Prymnesium_polylepis.1
MDRLRKRPELVAELQAAEAALAEHQRAADTEAEALANGPAAAPATAAPEDAAAAEEQTSPCAPAGSPAAPPAAEDSFAPWASGRGLYEVRELDLHFDAVCALWWEGGDALLTGSWDTSVKLCNLEAPTEHEVVRSWGGHAGKVRAVSLLREASIAVSGAADCSVRLWSLTRGMVGRIYTYAPLLGLDARDGRALTALQDGTLKLWALESGREERCVGRHGAAATSVHWHEPALALSTSADGTATLWDARAKDAAVVELAASAALLAGRAEAGSSAVIAADDEGVIAVWDVRRAGAPILAVAPHDDGCVARGVALCGSLALACGSRAQGRAGFVSVLDVAAGVVRESATPDVPPLGAVCARGGRALFGCRDGRVFVYDALLSPSPAAAEHEMSDFECRARLADGSLVRATVRGAAAAEDAGRGLRRRGRKGRAGDGAGGARGDGGSEEDGGGGPCRSCH